MYQYRKSALLSGAVSLDLTRMGLSAPAPERKDDDPSALGGEVKKAVDELGKTFEDFKKKNDERLKQAEKRGEDAVTKDEVEKLNKGIDDVKAELKKKLDEIEAKANRLSLGGGDHGAIEAKAAEAFGKIIGKSDFSIENLREYKQDLDSYLRSERKTVTLSVGSDPSGGFLVTPDTSGRMIKKVYDSSPMRQLASVVNIGTDALEGPIDNGQMDAQWIGEKASRAQTDAPQLGKWTISANELYAYPWTTQKVLEDANMDIEGWLAMKAAEKFARKETTGFYTGTGILQPKGILSYDFAATGDATRPWGSFEYVASGASGAFAASAPADKLIDLIFKLNPAYRANAKFQMARGTTGAVRKLKDGQGNYLVDLRLRDGALVETIFGFQNVDAEDMSALGADSYSIGFGDWAETYTIVDRLGVTVVRDNITLPGFVKFHFRKRVGGGAVNFESAKFMKFAAS
jgi:HK97 family phage major capsid protein